MWSEGRIARVIALALAVVAAPALASAGPAKPKAAAVKKVRGAAKQPARSVGAPNRGRLEGAALLKQSKHLKQREGARSWALPQMVSLLHHAAGAVARKHKGSGSHQTGRDADVAFYMANSRGKPIPMKRFIAFDDAGNARDVPGAHFDETRNWAMVEALLKNKSANVRYLFITNGLKARLLAHAQKKHAPKELIERAAAAMMSPPDADRHDDHFHVRIACPESMRDVCVEESTARSEPRAEASAP